MKKISMKAARVNAGLTQKQAADQLKVSRITLAHWESGATAPSAKRVDAICELYGMSYEDICFAKKFNSMLNNGETAEGK